MDKLKENGFALAVAGLAIGLVALMYFWVIVPYMDESGVNALESADRDLARLADEKKTPEYPTKKLENDKTQRQERLKEALQEAEAFYNTKKEQYDRFFADVDAVSILNDPSSFKGKYDTQIEQLRKDYIASHPEAAPDPEGKDEASLLGVQIIGPVTFATSEEIALGMKKYWAIEEVFNAVNKLGLGGLRKVEVKDPKDGGKGEALPDHFGIIRTLVDIHMPMSRVNALLGELHQSPRVPFLLDSVSIQKLESELIGDLVITKDYGEGQFPEEKADRENHPGEEPLVAVSLELWALDWKGLQKEDDNPSDRS